MGPLGKKQMEQLSGFTGSAITFGLASFLALVYITDWKAVSVHIPFYGSKFLKPRPPAKDCE